MHIQVPVGEYDEARQLIKGALIVRRKYMDLSMQAFCSTTALMLDDKLPPSSYFCSPETKGALYTSAGDVISSKCVCTCWEYGSMLVNRDTPQIYLSSTHLPMSIA